MRERPVPFSLAVSPITAIEAQLQTTLGGYSLAMCLKASHLASLGFDLFIHKIDKINNTHRDIVAKTW